MRPRILALLILLSFAVILRADPPPGKTSREALQPLGDLIGTWNGTGTPTGSREEVQKNFWTEKMSWEWQFKGADAWLKVDFERSKHFARAELRYVPDRDQYCFTVTTSQKEMLIYFGTLDGKSLTLERHLNHESQRLVFTLLHSNRFLYRYEVKAEDRPLFRKQWSVGATKEGEPFATGDGKPECVVSGGRGTTAVTYLGKTYYICCSGCRTEFNANPAKYVQEYEEKKAQKK